MSKLAGSDREKKITVRAPPDVVEEFDDWADARYESRSAAIRELMRDKTGPSDYDTPRQPPTEDALSEAYRSLVQVARATGSTEGYVREQTARRVVAGIAGLSKQDARDRLLSPLCRRGYIRHVGNPQGDSSYKILDYNNE